MPAGVVNMRARPRQRRRPVHRRAPAASPRSPSPAAPPPAARIVQASRRQPEEGAARARRQGRQHRVRGRRPGRPPSTAAPGRSSTTRARPASPARGCCCTRRSPMPSSSGSSRWRSPSAWATRSTTTTEMGPLTSAQHQRARAGLRRGGARAGRRGAGRRPGAGGGRAGARLLRRADHRARRSSARPRGAGRGLRPLRHRADLQGRRGGAGDRQRHRLRPGQRPVDRATCSAPTASPRELRAGMVWINSYKRVNPGSPFGGVGLSGYGREMGFDAMREYTQVKSVWVNVDAQIPPLLPALRSRRTTRPQRRQP